MRCAACATDLEAFTGDVCPQCQHFAHPTRLGIYHELELIKRGGMGSVYRARHPDLGTVVAIKTVHTHTGPESLGERFEREARLAARIPHPGVVRVFDYDCQEGRLYLVMEFVEGATLRQPIEAGDRDLSWRIDKVAQLAEILHTAHQRGIVHRDIKPENVMVDPTGRVRVLDFGISQVLEEGERLTQTGEILGTPEYIAPEQILDVPEAVDARTDVYATGVVLYELLTGISPFAGNNLFQVLKNVESREPPAPSTLAPEVSPALDALVQACMSKDRERRPADAGVLAARLRALAPAAPRSPVGSAAPLRSRHLLVAVLGIALGWAAGWGLTARRTTEAKPGPETPISIPTAREAAIAAIQSGLRENEGPESRTWAEAIDRLPDPSTPAERFWRGLAQLQTGALFAARRDLEQARDGGHAAAGNPAAELALYTTKLLPALLPALLPGGSVLSTWDGGEIPGETTLAAGLRALAKGDFAGGAVLLREVSDPDSRVVLLGVFASFLSGTAEPPVTEETVAGLASTPFLPRALLAALVAGPVDGTSLLEAALRRLDRLEPMRYALEIVVAARLGDDARLRAALELAQLTGGARFALAGLVAIRVERYAELSAAQREHLRKISAELESPHGAVVQRAIHEMEQLHGK